MTCGAQSLTWKLMWQNLDLVKWLLPAASRRGRGRWSASEPAGVVVGDAARRVEAEGGGAESGDRRRAASGGHLRRSAVVIDGIANRDERETEKWLERCAVSPGA